MSSPSAQPKITLTYSLQHIALQPGETIIGFAFEVSGGGFESISSLPKGWRIEIDNKALAHTTLRADLVFGPEAMSAQEMQQVVLKLVDAGLDGMTFRVAGHLLLSHFGKEHQVSLTQKQFVLREPGA